MTEAHVFWANPEEIPENALISQRRLLSAEELARCDKFVRPVDQLIFLTAHILLRRVLAQYLGLAPQEVVIHTGGYGKPYTRQGRDTERVQFSLSHTRGLVVCGVANWPIGIDVERFDRKLDLAMACSVLAESEFIEWEGFSEADRHRRFLSYWTLKEAYLKAIGTGLRISPKAVAFDVGNPEAITRSLPPALVSESQHDGPWQFHLGDQEFSHHVVAVACRSADCFPLRVIYRQFFLDSESS